MEYKYGNMSTTLLGVYKTSLIDRIFKLLPLKEEECDTIDEYIETLNHELFGMIATGMLSDENDDIAIVMSVINLIEHTRSENDHKIYRKDILKCCNLMKKVGGGDVR